MVHRYLLAAFVCALPHNVTSVQENLYFLTEFGAYTIPADGSTPAVRSGAQSLPCAGSQARGLDIDTCERRAVWSCRLKIEQLEYTESGAIPQQIMTSTGASFENVAIGQGKNVFYYSKFNTHANSGEGAYEVLAKPIVNCAFLTALSCPDAALCVWNNKTSACDVAPPHSNRPGYVFSPEPTAGKIALDGRIVYLTGTTRDTVTHLYRKEIYAAGGPTVYSAGLEEYVQGLKDADSNMAYTVGFPWVAPDIDGVFLPVISSKPGMPGGSTTILKFSKTDVTKPYEVVREGLPEFENEAVGRAVYKTPQPAFVMLNNGRSIAYSDVVNEHIKVIDLDGGTSKILYNYQGEGWAGPMVRFTPCMQETEVPPSSVPTPAPPPPTDAPATSEPETANPDATPAPDTPEPSPETPVPGAVDTPSPGLTPSPGSTPSPPGSVGTPTPKTPTGTPTPGGGAPPVGDTNDDGSNDKLVVIVACASGGMLLLCCVFVYCLTRPKRPSPLEKEEELTPMPDEMTMPVIIPPTEVSLIPTEAMPVEYSESPEEALALLKERRRHGLAEEGKDEKLEQLRTAVKASETVEDTLNVWRDANEEVHSPRPVYGHVPQYRSQKANRASRASSMTGLSSNASFVPSPYVVSPFRSRRLSKGPTGAYGVAH